MEKAIIVAIADNGAIGRKGQLLWHIPEDLKFFKRTTKGHPVIMGRKTFESIGRPLPQRTNIVISRNAKATDLWRNEGEIKVVSCLEDALDCAATACHPDTLSSSGAIPPDSHAENTDKVFVIGGGLVYAQALPLVDRLYVTHVHATVEDADTFFPEIDPSVWAIEEKSARFSNGETGPEFEFVTYTRK